MTRYIDADAVYKILESCEIRKATIGNPLTDWEYGYTCGIERAESEIECAPTIDAVPVIRCKDCKHMVEHKGYGYLGESAYTCESNMDGWILPDSYCSMAERKEE